MSDSRMEVDRLTAVLRDLVTELGVDEASDADLITEISLMEQLKGALAAAQASRTLAFEASQRRQAAARGVAARRQGDGVATQVALARRESPSRGAQLVAHAHALASELPLTRAALAAGEISEYRAQIIDRQTSCLSPEHRREADSRLAEAARGDGGLGQWGNRRLAAEALRVTYVLDPQAVVRRASRAARDRRVTCRPAPDTMSRVSGLLPVTIGVRVYATLRRDATALKSAGDERTLDQLMADLFAARLTGEDQAGSDPIALHLVMTDQALLDSGEGAHEPAWLDDHGPLPAQMARDLVREADRVSVRRLFTRPGTGELISMEARSRTFDGTLRRFLLLRDRSCRTPWCDASIRHADHVVPALHDGPTTASNGQGLCERCNYAKESPGIARQVPIESDGSVETVTATGHRYRSRPPLPPRTPPLRPRPPLVIELWRTSMRVSYEAAA